MKVKSVLTLAAAAHGSPGPCEDMMMQAFSQVNSAVGSSWMSERALHKDEFYNQQWFDGEQNLTGRLAKFEHNMRRWGKRFDSFSCSCPVRTIATMPRINSILKISQFLTWMKMAGRDMGCGKEHHMNRKVSHAQKIMRWF